MCLHCLTDQNHNFESGSSIHESYAEWTKDIIKNIDKSIPLYIKIHPHSDKFGETKAMHYFIKQCLEENNAKAIIIGPNDHFGNINQYSAVPIIITCGGTISLEVATVGMRAICSTESFCPDYLCARIYSFSQFKTIISSSEKCVSHILNAYAKTTLYDSDSNKEARIYQAFLESAHSSRSSNIHLKNMTQFYFFGDSKNRSADNFLDCYVEYCDSMENIRLDSNNCRLYLEASKLRGKNS